MLEKFRRLLPLLERLLPWFILGLLLIYTYYFFEVTPYAGFWYRSDGQVVELYTSAQPPNDLRLNDRLLKVGPVSWDDFRQNFRLSLFEGVKPGDTVPLVVERDGQTLTIQWKFPGRTLAELSQRLFSQWPIAYFFWFAGTVVALTIRPKDTRQRVLISFYYLTALWLAAGSGIASAHTEGAAIVLAAVAWLCVPVYWHLHFIFPLPFHRVNKWVWPTLYGAAIFLAMATWLGLLSPRFYVYGLLLAVVGALVQLFLHLRLQPKHRRDIGLLFTLVLLALLPMITAGLMQLVGLEYPYYAAGGTLLTLPLLPFGYFYAVYRRPLDGIELRRNRLLALYLFISLLGTVLVFAYAFASTRSGSATGSILLGVTLSLAAVLIAIFGYRPFQRFVERRILGIPPAPTNLLENYAALIATRLDTASLTTVLKDKILPALLVRQSALLQLTELGQAQVLYRAEISDTDLPTENEIQTLLTRVKPYWSRPIDNHLPPCSYAWAYLILPLHVGEQVIGLWMLGRRDPDDVYARAEVNVLLALANQTAIALAHLVQSERLRIAYKADVDRMEAERTSLARELHDHVLGDLAALKVAVETSAVPSTFLDIYERVTTSLRQTITELRPTMLNYGLHAALISLADALDDHAPNDLVVNLDLPETNVRYDVGLEQHLYRIVQQACENTLQHAHAHQLCLKGQLQPEHIDLTIEDDGVGFETSGQLDLAELISRRHFGLAGVYERATLIQAQLFIDSAPQRGTRVRIVWEA